MGSSPILRAFRSGCLVDGVEGNRGSVIAIKGVVAWQIQQAMIKGGIGTGEMAKRIGNGNATLNLLLAAFSILDCRHYSCRILKVNEGPWTKMNG
jgi:hypothetical protein